ncbi:hypothetical protein KEJ51_06200 [Candidatus Bathyarchaeota archaeon]|nr:hypothetical protein [Candidatus Bathyarchaeota archaeon]
MSLTRNAVLLIVIIVVAASSAYLANVILTAAANTGLEGPPVNGGACPCKRPLPYEWQSNITGPRKWQVNITVTDSQAKIIVNDALKTFTVGEVSDRGAVWIVSINYKGKPIMIVPLGKINTPTSQDALNAVQESLARGWSAGEPKQHGFIYNVPIIDSNGNIISNVRVDGRTGEIHTGFPQLRR